MVGSLPRLCRAPVPHGWRRAAWSATATPPRASRLRLGPARAAGDESLVIHQVQIVRACNSCGEAYQTPRATRANLRTKPHTRAVDIMPHLWENRSTRSGRWPTPIEKPCSAFFIGKTDRVAGEVASTSVSPKDILATIYHLLGIDPHTLIHDRLNRPFPIAGSGVVRHELLA